MLFLLQGRIALVTGSARGLGAAIAVRAAKHGADVFVSKLPGEDREPPGAAVRDCGVRGAGRERNHRQRRGPDIRPDGYDAGGWKNEHCN